MNLAIVVSETYWKEITSKMLDLALKTAHEENVSVEKIIKVPGSFDIPLAVKKLLQHKTIDGVITLGAVIEGETDHDSVISYAVAHALTQLSLEFEKPVVLGINGPKMSWEQAIARIPRAVMVTKACIAMVKELKK